MKNSNSNGVSDLLIHNANIYVERGSFAEALLIDSAGVIAAVGTFDEVRRAASEIGDASLRIIDAKGKTIIPGFNDAHLHLVMTGEAMQEVRLNEAQSIEEVIALGREYLSEHPETSVLYGRGWNQELFADEKCLLTRVDLDRISTEIPIIFERVCAHVICGNTRAAEISGVMASAGIEGVDVDENGVPTGITRETACSLYRDLRGADRDALLKSIGSASELAATFGITTVQTCDAGGSDWKKVFDTFEDFIRERLQRCIRFSHQCWFMNAGDLKAFAGSAHPQETPFNRISAVKLFMDGSLGARTARMRKPYMDEPGSRGIAAFSLAELTSMVEEAEAAGFPVLVHAIGDEAIETVLDAFDAVKKDASPRHGIVHVQITDTPLLERFAKVGVQAVVQPVFLKSDIGVVEKRVGKELASTSYAFGTIRKLGIPMSLSTDSPIESMNPFENLYFALTRRVDKDSEPFNASECLDIYDAVDAYTVGSAYTENAEAYKGRLRPGFAADLAVLDRNIFAVDAEALRNTRVEATMVAGKQIYGKI